MTKTKQDFYILRKASYMLITLFALLIGFQYFTNSPLAGIITPIEKMFTAAILSFVAVYLVNKIIRTKRLESIDVLALFLSFGIPLYTAILANIYWDQPVMYGFSTQKFWFIGLSALLIYYFLINQYITVLDIHRMMLGVAWFSLAVYLLVEVLFDASKWRDTNFVYCNPAKGGCGFKFNTLFLGYAMLFYFIKAVRENKNIFLLVSGLFFAYFLFFFQKRGIIIITGLLFFIILVTNTNKKRFVQYISIFLSTFILMLATLFVASQERFYTLVGQYGNFFEILAGEETGEGSADSRLRELATMFKFSAKHALSWVFGNGKWSDNWLQNPAIAEDFFPSDLGLLGVFFVYGIIGFLLVHIQFIYTLKWMKSRKEVNNNILYVQIKYFLLYFYLRSIFSGAIFFASGPTITLIFIMLIYYIKKTQTNDRLS
ncbi:MAG: hypothetical protein ACK5AS_04860 [Bacteroidota bacterium]|jgi:hypothetical protein